ncbi:MAG: hypothetical protein IPN42_18305 [Methylococcaceae bacterium]|nr:hypothetical protein [Methylococcaceae bacterium]
MGRSCACVKDLESALDWTKKSTGMAIVIPSGDGQVIKDADEIIQMNLATDYAAILQVGIDKLLE